MDVFYYWKDANADLKAGRVGYFKSSAVRFKELADLEPDFVWVFKTPQGLKGEVQLLPCLQFSKLPKKGFTPEKGLTYLHYDAEDPLSVWYVDRSRPEAVDAAIAWVKHHFPRMVSSNFQGHDGQAQLRGLPSSDLVKMTRSWPSVPFTTRAEAER